MGDQNELRFYLGLIKDAMKPQVVDAGDTDSTAPLFKPTYIVTAVKLPTGAIELAVNNENIAEKIDYILEAYDDQMRLKTNPDIIMTQIMVV